MSNLSEKSIACVFIAEIPNNITVESVYPNERYEEISGTSNERVRREKYFAWRLLEHALFKVLGINITDVEFRKGENGRWTAKGLDFSISHSRDAAAVVISDSSCGIDIEAICVPKADSFSKRVLTEAEYKELSTLSAESREEYLIEKWTQKEALFKARNLSAFVPSETVAQIGEYVKTESFIIGNNQYVCSVAFLSEYEKVDFELLAPWEKKF